MATCHLDIVIEPTHQGEILFQIECTAEIRYELDRGALTEWRVSDLKFGRTWSNPKVNAALLPLIDRAKVEDQLLDELADQGLLASTTAADRADYHAQVL